MAVTIQLDAKTSPAAGIKILKSAILNSRIVIATPIPSVTVKSIAANGTEFEIAFFVQELAQAARAQNELFDLIFRHLAASNIGLAASPDLPYLGPKAAEPQKVTNDAERILGLVAIFAALTADERRSLAAKLKQTTYDQWEVLVTPGKVLQSLFVVGPGVLSLRRVQSVGEIELMRLGPGDHFGEIGLLTGAAATAAISALVPTTVFELSKDDLAPILEARPSVAQELCRALAQRQAAGELVASPEIDAA